MRTSVVRVLFVLWAVLSAVLPGGLAVIHAGDAAAAAVPAPAHVESEGREGCVPVHGADCMLCSCVRWGAGSPPSDAPLLARDARHRAMPRDGQRVPASAEPYASFQPRAPPAV